MFEEEDENYSIAKFEAMLREKHISFFDVDEFEDIVGYYLENGKMSKAKRALEIALSQHPDASSLKLLQAELFLLEDKLEEATDLLDELESIEPMNAEGYVQRANLYSKLNNHPKAIELLTYATKFSPERGYIYALIGMEHLYRDDYQRAKEFFILAIKEDAEDYASLQQLLYCYDMLNNTQGAMEFLNKYLDKNPYCEVAWYYLGRIYLSQEEHKKALRCFDFAIISDDTFTGAYFEKARVLEIMGDFVKAIDNYKITLTLDDPSAVVYLHIGRCYEKMRDDKRAEEYYFKATHEDPQLSKAWITLADFYYLRGKHDQALKYILKVLSFEEGEPYFWVRYAELNRLHFGNLEQAEYGYRRAVQSGDYSYNTLTAWVDLMLTNEHYDEALPILSDIQQIYPHETSNFYRVAMAYEGMQEHENALTFYEIAVAEAPEWQSFFENKFNFKLP